MDIASAKHRVRNVCAALGGVGALLLTTGITAAHAGGMPKVVDGDPIVFGAGTAHTYVALDEAGVPTAVGVRFDATALDSLPIGPLPETDEFVLGLPDRAEPTVFDHVTLDWNSHGHDAEHGFDVPHVDVHFYLADTATIDTIDPLVPGYLEKAPRLPDPKYLPAGYEPANDPLFGTVPGMGLHWLDGTRDDHHFTETVLHGTWDGRHIFVEPMMTREWLQTRPQLHEDLRQPVAYQNTGLYPTTYSVTWDEAGQEYTVELGGLVPREAG